MILPDISFWIFVACIAVFVIGAAWLIKSYRDAKYAQYFFLREEAALRAKRLMFFLVPLAIVVVFLGLRLYGQKEEVALTGTPVAIETAAVAPTSTPAQTSQLSPTPALTATPTMTAAIQAVTSAPTVTATATPTAPLTGEQTQVPVTTALTPPTAEITAAALTPTTEIAAPTLTAAVTTTAAASPAITPTSALTVTVGPSPTPTVTNTPVFSTVTPSPAATVQNLVFSRAITPDNKPRSPGTAFSAGENYIYAFFEYHGMTTGVVWRHVWSRGAEELLNETRLWEWGSDGRAYVFFSPAGGYTPGQYRVQIYVGNELKLTGEFVVR